MGPAVVHYRFERLPSAFRYFPRAVFGRAARSCRMVRSVPRLEGRVEAVRANRRHLARYREVCGFADDGCLPLTYPHVLAMPLHFAILTHPRFVVRLMGLVHIANDIQQVRRAAGFRRGSSCEAGSKATATSIAGTSSTCSRRSRTGRVPPGSKSRRCSRGARRAASRPRAARARRCATRSRRDGSQPETAGHHGAPRHGPPLRLAFRRPQPDPPRRPRREAVRIRTRGGARHVVDGALVRGARARRARAARAGAWSSSSSRSSCRAMTRLEHWASGDRRVFVLKDSASGRPHLAGSTRPG